MSHALQQGARALGLAGILVLAIGGPATARQDAGELTPQGPNATTQITDEQYRCHYLDECSGPAPRSTRVLRVDDNAVEYLQLGAGALAGVGIGGAALAAASRRRHGQAALPA